MTRNSDFAKGYTDVDGQDDASPFIDFLSTLLKNEEILQSKSRIREMMRIHGDGRYLDLGCGIGYDTHEIARKLNPSGEAMGVDFSRHCIEYATAKYKDEGLPIRFAAGDAEDLTGSPEKNHAGFEDDYFDASKCERVFMHLVHPEKALSELKRVTKKGGRVVVMDPDLASIIINSDFNDISLKIIRAICLKDHPVVLHPFIGRQLKKLFVECGFHHIHLHVVTFSFFSLEQFDPIVPLDTFIAHAVQHNVISDKEGEMYRDNLNGMDQKKEFFASCCFFLVKGEV